MTRIFDPRAINGEVAAWLACDQEELREFVAALSAVPEARLQDLIQMLERAERQSGDETDTLRVIDEWVESYRRR